MVSMLLEHMNGIEEVPPTTVLKVVWRATRDAAKVSENEGK